MKRVKKFTQLCRMYPLPCPTFRYKLKTNFTLYKLAPWHDLATMYDLVVIMLKYTNTGNKSQQP